jgi:hypothetical protein
MARTSAKTIQDTPPKTKAPTKTERLIAMLGADSGVSIAEISEAFGWLPHSTRAALSGLRNGGHLVERINAKGEAARYRIRHTDGEAAS